MLPRPASRWTASTGLLLTTAKTSIDVYYVVTQTNPDTKQTNNILVKRGKELHEPGRMYLNLNQIILVEPVGTSSKVAQLIAQAK
jgi:hypothetical protein